MRQAKKIWKEGGKRNYIHSFFLTLFVVWPVAEVGRDEVCGGEWDGEEPLCEDDGSPEGEPGAPQLQEDHEVHALVLRLLQQGVDPTLTPTTHHTLFPAATIRQSSSQTSRYVQTKLWEILIAWIHCEDTIPKFETNIFLRQKRQTDPRNI